MLLLKENKRPQKDINSQRASVPEKLYIPLSQHTGKPSLPLVKRGDKVLCGQKIGEPQGLISSPVHTPVTGTVLGLNYVSHPQLGRCKAIILGRDGKDFDVVFKEDKKNAGRLSRQELLEKIKDKGIVGMGGACFPTYVKLNPPKRVDTLIVNGCECEPYLTCDYRLMLEEMAGIIEGIEITSFILGVQRIIFAIEDNKKDIKDIFNEKIKGFKPLFFKEEDFPGIAFKVLKTRYPQGAEKQLILKALKRTVPSGGLPFDVGVCVQNVSTLFAIYEAVYKDKPLIERLVTFSGNALARPRNLWVKIGSLVSDIIASQDLQLQRPLRKVICGGPMMGISQDTLDIPILKGTGGVLFFSDGELIYKKEYECIKCGMCVESCPIGLVPSLIYKYAKNSEFQGLRGLYPKDCIECGSCSFVCPSGIPLVEYIKWAKTKV